MPSFNSDVNSKKNKKNVHIEIVNKDFLPTRNEFETDKVEMDLKNAEVKEVVFFNEEVKYSKQNNNLKFTNFISDDKQQKQINAITRFSENISIVKNNTDEATNIRYNKRMLSILSLYTQQDIGNINGLMKTDIKGLLDVQEGLRVYWYYDMNDNDVKIVCVDPQHLVLPSRHGKMNKEEMMATTFNAVTNSKKHCISRYFIK
ncbi:hypothetical protein [Staphylococcus simiae]|uniref:Uncharacterized protein n=1 Tax=Staphylococcus simiae CCM 7213 = CCUG 51256 TaxID=911238 RepID=G5JLE4_9STAP|nr:hypothetical protein [Staphylococcus simiae]EHJ06985.1 hypothetical protein SS7213T_11550 [Staphylococcus simiae CCM 7213 = CCUG 51256]PNZ10956.1 hypothetical protein CD113_09245 [Staphylococcus simiae]SNV60731.1 Uncharacterised protein [Staphylococcus simiae]